MQKSHPIVWASALIVCKMKRREIGLEKSQKVRNLFKRLVKESWASKS